MKKKKDKKLWVILIIIILPESTFRIHFGESSPPLNTGLDPNQYVTVLLTLEQPSKLGVSHRRPNAQSRPSRRISSLLSCETGMVPVTYYPWEIWESYHSHHVLYSMLQMKNPGQERELYCITELKPALPQTPLTLLSDTPLPLRHDGPHPPHVHTVERSTARERGSGSQAHQWGCTDSPVHRLQVTTSARGAGRPRSPPGSAALPGSPPLCGTGCSSWASPRQHPCHRWWWLWPCPRGTCWCGAPDSPTPWAHSEMLTPSWWSSCHC